MSSSPLSTALLSPLTNEDIQQQLKLEERLQEVGEQLLETYKRTRQWKLVGQLAQTLSSNSDRIVCLTHALSSQRIFTFNEMDSSQSEVQNISVSKVEDTDKSLWIVSFSNNEPVQRTLEDFEILRVNLTTKHSMQILPLTSDVSSLVLQEMLISAVKDVSVKNDTFLNCFLSSKILDFSSMCNGECI